MAYAQDEKINYDESKVLAYTLPDPLKMQDGRAVTSGQMWLKERRPELLELFQVQVYGRRMPDPRRIEFRVAETSSALGGKATRKRVEVILFDAEQKPFTAIPFTLLAPVGAKKPVPAFVGLHLFDTAAERPIPGKLLADNLGADEKFNQQLPGDGIMGVILDRGYAIATLDAKDFCPDDKEKFRERLLGRLFPDRSGPPGPEEPGAISTWAWALSRALDYFATDPEIDAKRVAVIGHSRMGKTALWAGAQDERFALVISNNSGCGGAALSRRDYGETVARINRVFPHWFCDNFSKYNDHEEQLPVDQHELIALVAPRPVYVASARQDRWADPRGEFLAALGAEPVYKLFGKEGLGVTEPPADNESVGGQIGYHLRVGKHALTDFDWLKYLDFADRHLR